MRSGDKHKGRLKVLRTYQKDEIKTIWPELAPLIKKVLKKHEKEYTLESIKEMLLNQEVQLWTSYNGQLEAFVLTHIAIYPKHKICDIFTCGGSNLGNWLRPITALISVLRKL